MASGKTSRGALLHITNIIRLTYLQVGNTLCSRIQIARLGSGLLIYTEKSGVVTYIVDIYPPGYIPVGLDDIGVRVSYPGDNTVTGRVHPCSWPLPGGLPKYFVLLHHKVFAHIKGGSYH